jgi:hypothetical protein
MLTLPVEQKPIISELEKPAPTLDKADTTPSVRSASAPSPAAAPPAPVPNPVPVPVVETKPAVPEADKPLYQAKKNGSHAAD